MGQLETALSKEKFEGLKQWCLQRQKSGFQGRPNKDVDTCYSFWVGASLDVRSYVSTECFGLEGRVDAVLWLLVCTCLPIVETVPEWCLGHILYICMVVNVCM